MIAASAGVAASALAGRALSDTAGQPPIKAIAFDGFPIFSPDGTKLVFASNRASKVRGETNIFLADWVE